MSGSASLESDLLRCEMTASDLIDAALGPGVSVSATDGGGACNTQRIDVCGRSRGLLPVAIPSAPFAPLVALCLTPPQWRTDGLPFAVWECAFIVCVTRRVHWQSSRPCRGTSARGGLRRCCFSRSTWTSSLPTLPRRFGLHRCLRLAESGRAQTHRRLSQSSAVCMTLCCV